MTVVWELPGGGQARRRTLARCALTKPQWLNSVQCTDHFAPGFTSAHLVVLEI